MCDPSTQKKYYKGNKATKVKKELTNQIILIKKRENSAGGNVIKYTQKEQQIQTNGWAELNTLPVGTLSHRSESRPSCLDNSVVSRRRKNPAKPQSVLAMTWYSALDRESADHSTVW